MKVTPLADRVLIRMEQGEAKTKGGLYIPDTAKEKTQTGIVDAIGDDKDAITVKVGDKVMYDKYAGTTVEVDSVEYLIIKAADILAVLK